MRRQSLVVAAVVQLLLAVHEGADAASTRFYNHAKVTVWWSTQPRALAGDKRDGGLFCSPVLPGADGERLQLLHKYRCL